MASPRFRAHMLLLLLLLLRPMALVPSDKIIRSRAKVTAIIHNAKLAQALEAEHPSGFVGFVWDLRPRSDRERLVHPSKQRSNHMRDVVDSGEDRLDADGVHPTAAVAAATKALRARGFKFMGETTVLSFMQAAGLVNHHNGA